MKNLGLSLVAFALIVNMIVASMGGLMDDGSGGTEDPTDIFDDTANFEDSNITSVEALQLNIHDMATYSHRIYVAWYGEDTSSGEWHKLELIALGQTTDRIGDLGNFMDGFFENHQCVPRETITTGSAELIYSNSSGGELSLGGTLEMDRIEHWDISAMRPIAISNGGGITISGLGSLFGDGAASEMGDLSFTGSLRTWPDLTKDHVPSLEEKLFMNGQTLEIGDTGTVQQPPSVDADYALPYEWEVQQGLVIHDYDTVMLNVTSELWDIMPYYKEFWISNELSMPARMHDFTKYVGDYPDYNYSEYIVIENEQILKEDGWNRGDEPVPWAGEFGDSTPAGHFRDKNPYGEYKSWYGNMMPVEGDNFDNGGYYFSTNEYVEESLNLSTGFQDFCNNFTNDITIASARTNATLDSTDRNDKAGEFWWEGHFFYKPTQAEYDAAMDYHEEQEEQGVEDPGYNAEWVYWLQVKKTVENVGSIANPSYETTYEIVNESIMDYPWTYYFRNKYYYPTEVLTQAGFENIMRQDTETYSMCFDDSGNLKWNKDPAVRQEDDDWTQTTLSVSDEGGDEFMDMMTMITGLSMPSFDFVWWHNRGWTGNDGYQFEIDVNAANGQLLGVIYVEGTEFMKFFS